MMTDVDKINDVEVWEAEPPAAEVKELWGERLQLLAIFTIF